MDKETELREALKQQYIAKAAYFWRLAICAEVSATLIEDLRGFYDKPFPPTDKILNHYENNSYSEESGIVFDERYTEERLVALFNEESIKGIIQHIFNRLATYTVDNIEHAEIITNYCKTVRLLYLRIANADVPISNELINPIEELALLVNAQAHKQIGYWMKMVVEMKRNKQGGEAKAIKCEERINRLAKSVQIKASVKDGALMIEKSQFDELCRMVLDIRSDASYPTKKKYLGKIEKLLEKPIKLTK